MCLLFLCASLFLGGFRGNSTVHAKHKHLEHDSLDFLLFWYTLHNIQLTPQKLSAWRKNHPGAPGAGVWPEDQKRHRGRRKKRPPTVSRGFSSSSSSFLYYKACVSSVHMYVCMYVKIRRHQHTRVHAHTGPRRHARAPACHRHHIPRLVRRQAFHTDHHR